MMTSIRHTNDFKNTLKILYSLEHVKTFVKNR